METSTLCMLVVFGLMVLMLFALLALCAYKKEAWKTTKLQERLDDIRNQKKAPSVSMALDDMENFPASGGIGSFFGLGGPGKMNVKWNCPRMSVISEGGESSYGRSKSICSANVYLHDSSRRVSTVSEEEASVSDCSSSDKSFEYQKQNNNYDVSVDKTSDDCVDAEVYTHSESDTTVPNISETSESQASDRDVSYSECVGVDSRQAGEDDKNLYRSIRSGAVLSMHGDHWESA